ncbi:hypothetical protein Tco_0727803 [Tanacetum coccineum]|uniref:Uncharacterized protein n=1 Tax=Tanacetum coccineum TaxID=301880 RepID=A0ABQ4YLY7_9ASTR
MSDLPGSSISFDDLYNNFKIVKPEVKRSVTSSSNSGSQNLAFIQIVVSLKEMLLTKTSDSNGLEKIQVNKSASENVSKEVKKTSDAPIIEDWVSDCDEIEIVGRNNVSNGLGSQRNYYLLLDDVAKDSEVCKITERGVGLMELQVFSEISSKHYEDGL